MTWVRAVTFALRTPIKKSGKVALISELQAHDRADISPSRWPDRLSSVGNAPNQVESLLCQMAFADIRQAVEPGYHGARPPEYTRQLRTILRSEFASVGFLSAPGVSPEKAPCR